MTEPVEHSPDIATPGNISDVQGALQPTLDADTTSVERSPGIPPTPGFISDGEGASQPIFAANTESAEHSPGIPTTPGFISDGEGASQPIFAANTESAEHSPENTPARGFPPNRMVSSSDYAALIGMLSPSAKDSTSTPKLQGSAKAASQTEGDGVASRPGTQRVGRSTAGYIAASLPKLAKDPFDTYSDEEEDDDDRNDEISRPVLRNPHK